MEEKVNGDSALKRLANKIAELEYENAILCANLEALYLQKEKEEKEKSQKEYNF